MALGTEYAQQDCSLARTLEVVGERWTLLILRDCFLGVRRFADFATHLDISKAVLTERLGSPGRRRAAADRPPRGAPRLRPHRARPEPLAGPVHDDPVGRGASRPTGRRRVFEHRPCAAALEPSGRARRAGRCRDRRRSTRTRGRGRAACAPTRCRGSCGTAGPCWPRSGAGSPTWTRTTPSPGSDPPGSTPTHPALPLVARSREPYLAKTVTCVTVRLAGGLE